MIDGRRQGPFSLDQLAGAGVRPSTYVWCKGMPDWKQADEVADICRVFRQRVHDLAHPSHNSGDAPVMAGIDAPQPENRTSSRYGVELPSVEELENNRDTSAVPNPWLGPAVFTAIFCFPLTGIFAIMYAVKCRMTWKTAVETSDRAVADNLRKLAHDYARSARMWTGITFFLGFFIAALLLNSLL